MLILPLSVQPFHSLNEPTDGLQTHTLTLTFEHTHVSSFVGHSAWHACGCVCEGALAGAERSGVGLEYVSGAISHV